MKFRSWLYALDESFDTPQKVQKTYVKNGTKFYEFYVGEHEYRVVLDFVELNGLNGCEIVFERKVSETYKTQIITNDLSKSEVMALFSTVLFIGKKNKLNNYNFIYARTDNEKKARVYLKLFKNMFPGYDVYLEEGLISSVNAYKEDYEVPEDYISKFLKLFKYNKK